jgi:putative tributyrin esterase
MHGVGGHQLNMIERFSTPDILNDLIGSGELPECIAVFIDGYNSFYYDGPGLAMETAIIHDLIPFIDKTYNTLASKEGRIIGGISMGGYGAARFAVKYPQMFSAALMMSPAVWRNSQGNACSSLHLFNNFDQATWDAEHPVAFLASYTVANSPVKFYAIHGTEDTVVPPADVEAFVEKLSQVAEVEYVPYEGGIHAWTTWKETCREALKYAGKVLQA